ncbi:MAG: DUF933 domain-containing protein, partial [Pseudomonadota bacterium]
KLELLETVFPEMSEGKPARRLRLDQDSASLLNSFNLLTAKPILFACNVEEEAVSLGNRSSAVIEQLAQSMYAHTVIVAASIEAEVASLNGEDQAEFLADIDLEEPSLNRVIRESYALLQLLTFFTAGTKETRAWAVHIGARAPEAAGTIHTDFARGFIAAEVIAYDDYTNLGGEQACREQGKMRLEGRDYIMRDGDICHFRFNV